MNGAFKDRKERGSWLGGDEMNGARRTCIEGVVIIALQPVEHDGKHENSLEGEQGADIIRIWSGG